MFINIFKLAYLIDHTDPPDCANCHQLLFVKRILTEWVGHVFCRGVMVRM